MATQMEHEYWDDRSQTFDRDNPYIVGAGLNDEIKAWLQQQFARTETVLELGSGTGIFSEAIAPIVKHLTATDASEPMLQQARAKLGQYGNIKFQKEDASHTSFGEASFDAVFMVNLLHIVQTPALILKECRRVVKSDGKVVVVDITLRGAPLLEKIGMVIRYVTRWGLPPASNRNMSLDELAGLMQEAGFLVKDRILIGTGIKAACLTGYKQALPTKTSERIAFKP
jgi:ubiquinone/menaquinone biosynthesis C-methylase UbiE